MQLSSCCPPSRRIRNIPILCLGVIPTDHLHIAEQNNITITINPKDYVKEVIPLKLGKLKVHIKINGGMNRLEVSSKEELQDTICLLNQSNMFVEGIYTHIYNAWYKEKRNQFFHTYTNSF